MKLGSATFTDDPLARLAALDCRVLIKFDPMHPNSRNAQTSLVKSYMRTVFNIPEGRDYMWSGYPSEPILAEAAARLLNNKGGDLIMHQAPLILESALSSSFLARGERGELVARTLFTVAHDRAIMSAMPDPPAGPHFHRPVRFVEFLEHLLAPDIWAIVQDAPPGHAYPDSPSLKVAFQDAWVNFSHFVQLGNLASFTLHCASELLKRGAAMQTFDNQYNLDGGIPILHGDPSTTTISQNTTNVARYQVKNAAKQLRVAIDPRVVDSNENFPIITIIMQLGVEKEGKERVVVQTINKQDVMGPAGDLRPRPPSIQRRHYDITLYGCTSKTYSCIPENSLAYSRLLRTQKLMTNFPRANYCENLSSFFALKPVIHDMDSVSMSWGN